MSTKEKMKKTKMNFDAQIRSKSGEKVFLHKKRITKDLSEISDEEYFQFLKENKHEHHDGESY